MGDPIICVENLGKKYLLDHQKQERYTALRDVMSDRVKALWRPFQQATVKTQAATREEFWALKDVSFEVNQGDRVGIIGRNGAGKSTLLKILSRITEPTTGRIRIKGRVASLLEVGTGFHPELTGRENIFLNGAILGMSRAEINRKFDEIVAFAEVEKFLDTPVKRYSSGMYVRLAFAVAAHLEPEILIVDEVLAVGDAAFQKKCLGKMDQVSKEGRTVLFVSHNMAAIKRLCNYSLLFNKGLLELRGETDKTVRVYLSNVSGGHRNSADWMYRHKGRLITIDKVKLLVNGDYSSSIQAGNCLTIRINYSSCEEAIGLSLSVSIMLFSEGQKLVNLWTNYNDGTATIAKKGFVECSIPKWSFRSHSIRVDVYTHIGSDVQDWIEECLIFDSYDGDYYQSGIVTNPDQGLMFLEHRWTSYANE